MSLVITCQTCLGNRDREQPHPSGDPQRVTPWTCPDCLDGTTEATPENLAQMEQRIEDMTAALDAHRRHAAGLLTDNALLSRYLYDGYEAAGLN